MGIITFSIDAFTNSPPDAIGDNSITIEHNETYTFTSANWTSETNPPYSDPDGDIPDKLKILTDPATLTGDLEYNSIAVTQNQEISFTGIKSGLLKYIGDAVTTTAYTDDINFDISDNGSNTYSGITGINMTMDVQAYVNQPPTTGDNTISGIAHASEVTITTANLTTGTTPAYSDPEGDPAFSLRVNTLPANGILLLNGSFVRAGDVITFTDIGNNLFTYRASRTVETSYSDTFDFDIQDTGSGQWSS